jgi:hypothetical protein
MMTLFEWICLFAMGVIAALTALGLSDRWPAIKWIYVAPAFGLTAIAALAGDALLMNVKPTVVVRELTTLDYDALRARVHARDQEIERLTEELEATQDELALLKNAPPQVYVINHEEPDRFDGVVSLFDPDWRPQVCRPADNFVFPVVLDGRPCFQFRGSHLCDE